MSYITRTSTTVMIDQTCFNESLQRLEVTNLRTIASKVSFTHAGKSWVINRLPNGAYSCREQGQGNEAAVLLNLIGNTYLQIQEERRKAVEKELQRIATLQKQLAELNENVSFDGVKHKEAEFNREKVEKELATSRANLSAIEKKSSELEKSRLHYLSMTKEQVELQAKKGNWGVTALDDNTTKRQTRIQLRRRVKN